MGGGKGGRGKGGRGGGKLKSEERRSERAVITLPVSPVRKVKSTVQNPLQKTWRIFLAKFAKIPTRQAGGCR
jgi:hypothetical protein